MTGSIGSLYRSALEEISSIEERKREISNQILLMKDKEQRLRLIYSFLAYDLDKHELFERITVIALVNNEGQVLRDIEELYSYLPGDQQVKEKISIEIKFIKKYLSTVKKGIDLPDHTSFFERRLIQEIMKFVIEQARQYNKSFHK